MGKVMLRSSSKDVKSALGVNLKSAASFTSAEGPLQLVVALRAFDGYTNGFVKCDALNYDTAQRELSVGPLPPPPSLPFMMAIVKAQTGTIVAPAFTPWKT